VASQNWEWGEGIEPEWGSRNCETGKHRNWDTKVIFPVSQLFSPGPLCTTFVLPVVLIGHIP
jgi:hypothetical protein